MIGFGQIDFNLNDVKSIDSEEKFKRFFLEKGFIRKPYEGGNLLPEYVVWYHYSNKDYFINALWLKGPKQPQVQFYLDESGNNYLYDKIVNQIKNECDYFEMKEENGGDNLWYKCPGIDDFHIGYSKKIHQGKKIGEIIRRRNTIVRWDKL